MKLFQNVSRVFLKFSQNYHSISWKSTYKCYIYLSFTKTCLLFTFRNTFKYVSKTVTQFSQIFSKFHYISAQFLRCFLTGVSKFFRINSTLSCNFNKTPTKKYEIFIYIVFPQLVVYCTHF